MLITVDGFIKFGSVLGVLGILWKIFKTIRDFVKTDRESKEEPQKTIQTLVDHDKEQYLGILRLTIMSSEMPIKERVLAGENYVKEGGNGAVKRYYEEYLSHLHEDTEE